MESIINDADIAEAKKLIEIICLSEDLKKQLERDPLINYASIIRLKSAPNFTLDPWHLEFGVRPVLIIVSDKIYNLNVDTLNVLDRQQEEGRCILFVGPQSQKEYTHAILNDIHKIKDIIKSLCIVILGSYPAPFDFVDIRNLLLDTQREVKLFRILIKINAGSFNLLEKMKSLHINNHDYHSYIAHFWFPNGVPMTAINNILKDFLIGFEQLVQHTDYWGWGYSSGDPEIINAYSWMPGLISEDDPINHFPKDEIVLSFFTTV